MKNEKIRVVIDTNIFLISISSKSKAHWIFQKILNNEIELCITNEVFTEYEEILTNKLPDDFKDYIIDFLIIAGNVIKVIPYFKWNLINIDQDDNKFIDCTIASNADYLITNDRHFDVVKNINFPKVNIINADDFKKLFE